jgi:DNA-binding IclR family transcriptional regulator
VRPVATDPGAQLAGGAGRHANHSGIRRVLRMLEAVSQPAGVPTARDLAARLGVSRSTAYMLLGVLEQEGYVVKLHGGGYALGPTAGALGERRREQGVGARTAPIAHALALRSGRPAHVAVLDGGEAAIVASAAPPLAPPVGIAAGFRGATHALAAGKVLLAGGGVALVDRYLGSHALEPFTSRTVTDPARLEAQVRDAGALGFAVAVEELSPCLCCVAVPLRGPDGAVRAALAVSTTARRFAAERGRLVAVLRAAAASTEAGQLA